MILETDKALQSLLRAEVLGDAPISVAFDAPNRPWIQAVKGVVLNLYLYDVRENMQRRDVMYTEIRDDNGKIVERRPPPRRFDLYYALTVWAPKVPLEHQILACVLAGLSEHEAIPKQYLEPALADSGYVVLLSIADGMKRGMLQNLGGELKMSLEVVVTVPVFGKMPLPLRPPVSKPVQLKVNGESPEQVQGRSANGQPVPAGAAGPAGPAGGKPAAGGGTPSAVREAQKQAMAAAAGSAQPGAGGPAGAQAGAGAPPGARPGQPGQPGQRPAQPGQRPGQPGQAPANPIQLAQAALAQAAQTQAMLAQAQAALVKVLTAAAKPPPGAGSAPGGAPGGSGAPPEKPTTGAAPAGAKPATGPGPAGGKPAKAPKPAKPPKADPDQAG